jgi:ectoine hydroxylase-related dioxygenase (phytanoyl-CoA dioxygenase family)
MNSVKVALSAEEKDRLDHDGFLVLENFVESGKLAALRRRITELFAELGDRAGYEFKREPQTDRLANLVDYDEIFRWAIAEPKLLACVEHTLGHDYKLSSLNARSARPRSDWTQPLHCDTGALPDERGNFVERLKTIVKGIPEIELALIKIFLLLGTFLTLSKWLWSEICQLLK